jgi:proline dehydrogenase
MGLLELAARRFVAGRSIDEAVRAIRQLNDAGIVATVDFLGENVSTKEDATAAADEYLHILGSIQENALNCNVSVKLTMMGMEVDPDFCFENVSRIISKAQELNNFVRIDMEGSAVTKLTLDLFDRFHEKFDNVGIVIQAYLHRSEEDIRRLAETGVNVRLCKGAYKEPAEVAIQKKEDVNSNYLRLGKILLDGNGKACIATHDPNMIEPLIAYINERQLPPERYELQMLYGIQRKLQRRMAEDGHTVRIYVPYGTDWLGYFTRRMMERRENFLFAFKQFFKA